MVAWSLVTRRWRELWPRSAVVRYNGKAWAYLRLDDKTFTRREVALEIPAEDGWFISQGLMAEDRIVVNGAQTLLSEELKSHVTTEQLG